MNKIFQNPRYFNKSQRMFAIYIKKKKYTHTHAYTEGDGTREKQAVFPSLNSKLQRL